MPQRSASLISPLLSMVSPTTFNKRPNVASPTGTVMAEPVSTATMPRTSPSVEDIATHLTVLLPRCCSTSNVKFTLKSLLSWSSVRITTAL